MTDGFTIDTQYKECPSYVFVFLAPDQKKLKYLIEPPVYAEVIARRGENASLPCILQTKPNHFKVKWTKLQPENPGPENIVLISNGYAFKLYGLLGPRVSLRNAHTMDASLHIHHLELQDGGRYRCELINGIEDENVIVTLRIEGNDNHKHLVVVCGDCALVLWKYEDM